MNEHFVLFSGNPVKISDMSRKDLIAASLKIRKKIALTGKDITMLRSKLNTLNEVNEQINNRFQEQYKETVDQAIISAEVITA